MNNQIVPVFDGTISDESALLCNARDLHRFLGVGKMFAHWIKERIAEYEFVENQDYILLAEIGKQTSGRGGHNRKDYHLTLDTAKELAMVERNEKGRQIRRYFIECEKRLRRELERPTAKHTITTQDLQNQFVDFELAWCQLYNSICMIDRKSAEQMDRSIRYVLMFKNAYLSRKSVKRMH